MIIKEFFPNPVGNDKDGEYVKLFNDGADAISLNGWVLKDASGKNYKLSGILDAGRELILPYSRTKISLNNNGEKIFLYDGAGGLVNELGYSGQAEEGEIITRNEKLEIKDEKLETSNGNLSTNMITNQVSHSKIVFLDFLTAGILAGLVLYIILQIEKKLNIKLF